MTPLAPDSDERGNGQDPHSADDARPAVAVTTLRTVTPASGRIMCHFCGGTKFRRSRVQASDLLDVLMLRYPMRCMRCNQRQYGYLLTASLAHAGKTYH